MAGDTVGVTDAIRKPIRRCTQGQPDAGSPASTRDSTGAGAQITRPCLTCIRIRLSEQVFHTLALRTTSATSLSAAPTNRCVHPLARTPSVLLGTTSPTTSGSSVTRDTLAAGSEYRALLASPDEDEDHVQIVTAPAHRLGATIVRDVGSPSVSMPSAAARSRCVMPPRRVV